MYFIPQKSWVFHYLHTFSTGKRYLGTIILLCLVTISWYFGMYRTAQKIKKNYEQAYVQHNNLLHECMSLKKEYHVHEKNTLAYQQKLKKIYSKQKPFDVCIAKIFDALHHKNLCLQAYTPGIEASKNWYHKVAVSYTIEGTFEDLIHFFNFLATNRLVGTIKTFCIQKIYEDRLRMSFFLDMIFLQENNNE